MTPEIEKVVNSRMDIKQSPSCDSTRIGINFALEPGEISHLGVISRLSRASVRKRSGRLVGIAAAGVTRVVAVHQPNKLDWGGPRDGGERAAAVS